MIWREGFYTLRQVLVPTGSTTFNQEDVMRLRLAEIQDAEAIVSVINSAFRPAESFFIDADRIDLLAVTEFLHKGNFLVAEQGGVVEGCVYVELRGDRSYLGLLAVDPRIQKSGLGSKLVNAAEDYCTKAGSRFMDLQTVNLRRDNRAFYRRRGYIETDTAPFPAELNPKVPCHFVKLSKPLTCSE
jgi:GNAT superfamily N-acetyltransferase